MSAISLDKRLLFRIAFFAVGVVGAWALLNVSGVQRINNWIIVVGWPLVPLGVYFFSRRRAK